MSTPGYSLSSGSNADPACSRSKTRRVSAQLSRLMNFGSRESASENYTRRGISEDGTIIHDAARRRDNVQMSKAAAWMWHTQGNSCSTAALPTKLHGCRPVNGSASNAHDATTSCRNGAPACIEYGIDGPKPSRFKMEANMMGSASVDLLYSISPEADQDSAGHEPGQASSASYARAAHCTLDGGKPDQYEKQPPAEGNTFLYDQFELSCLQDLLEPQIHKQFKSLSSSCAQPSSGVTSSSRQTKAFSALHKLFKKFYTIVVHKSPPNPATLDQPNPSTGLYQDKPRSKKHVMQIHHHHHHYHHYHSVDIPAHFQSPPARTPDLQGILKRRRHSESPCSGALHVNRAVELDHIDNDAYKHRPRRSSTDLLIDSAAHDAVGG